MNGENVKNEINLNIDDRLFYYVFGHILTILFNYCMNIILC